jgi:hypothetical protein
MASHASCRRSRVSEILDVALLRLWFRKPCGLGLNRDLPFLDGHYFSKWHLALHAGVLGLFGILDGALLRLRFRKPCGLGAVKMLSVQ